MEHPRPQKQTFSRELRIPVEGEFYVQLPELYDEARRWPLLLFLHGPQQADCLFDLTAPPRLALENGLPLVVLTPRSEEVRWNVDTLIGLLQEIGEQLPIDPRRIYATGVCTGALATWELALRCPETLAAIVPISGAGQPWTTFRIAHLPAWVFHGAKDELVPVSESQDMVSAINADGGNARLTVYADEGRGAWERAYSEPELWTWLLSQRTPE